MSFSANTQQVFEGVSATKYFSDRGNQPTVYKESGLPINPAGITRIWISFDIEEDPEKTRRKALYEWFNSQIQIESWGNSVATFLAEGYVVYDKQLSDKLISELTKAKVLNANKWAETPGISLYITYESRIINTQRSGHFVLIQNAKIMQANGFKC